MSNNTEVIFENIEQRIIKEIEESHYAIFVSVAWFTNKKLFNALLEKAKQNCYVSIIIQLDEINSQSGIDYSQIQVGRSECFKISKDAELLHDKFCVIDFKKVITGSYNWTYKASHNSENILILNDPSVATQYISRFEQQKAKFNDYTVQPQSNQQIISNTTVNQQGSSPQQHKIAPPPIPTTKQCSHCKSKVGHLDRYCEYCGKLQDGFSNNKDIAVTCLECSRVQNSSLIDVLNTRFCTFCGSNLLAWAYNNLIQEDDPDDFPF